MLAEQERTSTVLSGCFGGKQTICTLAGSLEELLGGPRIGGWGSLIHVLGVLLNQRLGRGSPQPRAWGNYWINFTKVSTLLWLWELGLFFLMCSIVPAPALPCPVDRGCRFMTFWLVTDHPLSSDHH